MVCPAAAGQTVRNAALGAFGSVAIASMMAVGACARRQ
jgi:hypothetical protein